MKQIVEILKEKNNLVVGSVLLVDDYIQDDEYYQSYGDYYYDIFINQRNVISKVSFIEKSNENITYTISSETEYDLYLENIAKSNKIQENKNSILKCLMETDFTMLEDVGISNKDYFKAYRSKLRELLSSSEEVLAGDIVLPLKPQEIWN